MEAGKDYFTDKTPFTDLAQLDAAKAAVARTGRKYMVYFSERLHVESAMYATDLVASGAIGRVIQVIGLGRNSHGLRSNVHCCLLLVLAFVVTRSATRGYCTGLS